MCIRSGWGDFERLPFRREQGGGVVRKLIDWKEVPFREYPWTLRSMQIYASYEHRRDLVEAAKSPGALMRTRPLLVRSATDERHCCAFAAPVWDGTKTRLWSQAHEMQGGCAEASRTQRWVKLDPPAMRQSVAWDLALRNIRNQEVCTILCGQYDSNLCQTAKADLGASFMTSLYCMTIACDHAPLNHEQVEEAAASLRKQTGTDIVKDVRVRVEILRRRARLLFLPAYVANYSYGERFNAHGEREPMSYQAFIGGFGATAIMAIADAQEVCRCHRNVIRMVPQHPFAGGEVVAERHYHPWKAQLAAAGLLGGLGMATAAVFANPGSVVAWEHGFWLFIVCLTAGDASWRGHPMAADATGGGPAYRVGKWCDAGAGARMAPQLLRQAAESRRIEEEEVDFERVLAAGVGPLDTGNAEQEAMRVNAEWRRWEDADKWNWNARKRQAWAEQLWRNQHTRCIQRARFVRNIEARRCQIIEARRCRIGRPAFSNMLLATGPRSSYACKADALVWQIVLG